MKDASAPDDKPGSGIPAAVPAGSAKASLTTRLGHWLGRGKPAQDKAGAGGTARDRGGGGNEAAGAYAIGARDETKLRKLFLLCLEARQTDGAANQAAREFMQRYVAAGNAERVELMRVMAQVCGDHADERSAAGSSLAGALASTRIRFFKRFNAMPGGLPFLVNLRAGMLRQRKAIPGLAPLEEDLGGLFSTWFDVGFLELRPITWDSPASLLEKLMVYEAVHEISSWSDLRNRLDSDRRCYAFFHPRLPNEPLIFVEVAFVPEMAEDIQALLDETAPLEDLARVRWAIFYSISNTQPGLHGVSFGNFLLKRVIEALQEEFPKLRNFATLSPIPSFADWLKGLNETQLRAVLGERRTKKLSGGKGGPAAANGSACQAWLLEDAGGKAINQWRRETGEALAAHYLARERDKGLPLDPVARFHLGNGARVERLNWRADLSKKGLRQSCGMMVNYLYVLDALDVNLQKLINGEAALGRAVAKFI